MKDYIIVYVKPFAHNVTHDIASDYELAVAKARQTTMKRKWRDNDVLIVERTQEDGVVKYKLMKVGFGRVYDLFNKFLLTLVFAIFVYIFYLYIHYIH